MRLTLEYPDPKSYTEDDKEIQGRKIGIWTTAAQQMREERWQGKLLNNRWEDDDLNTGYFNWLSKWKTAPSHTIADVHEHYQELLPTKLYHHKKTRTNSNPDVQCRLCGKTKESVSHILVDYGPWLRQGISPDIMLR